MEIGATQHPQTATKQAADVPPSKGALSSDFETFLKMLTVQMRNQDPLNPVESADFAVQLATFSTVEQQVRTNDLLTTLGDRIGMSGMAQFAGWIGMEARAEMPVAFNGAPVRLTLRADTLAETAQLVVRDATGAVVQRQDVSASGGEILWAGVDDDGSPLPPGFYQISTETFAGGELGKTHPVEVHARIAEARQRDGETVLIMQDGQEVPAAQILSLRAPDQE